MEIGAIFESANEAMRFGYAYSCQQWPVSVLSKLIRAADETAQAAKRLGTGKGLFGLDGAAICGTIKRHVEALPMPNPLILEAKYTIDDSRLNALAVDIVPLVVPALGSGAHSRRLIQMLICRYFGMKIDGKKIELSHLCSRFPDHTEDSMKKLSAKIRRKLRELDCVAEIDADSAMRESGLVGYLNI